VPSQHSDTVTQGTLRVSGKARFTAVMGHGTDPPVTVSVTAVVPQAVLSAAEECAQARRWYRLACHDADHFAQRAIDAYRTGDHDDARAYVGQFLAASDARRRAWAEYRRAVAVLTQVVQRTGPLDRAA
jgi:hypothetical protein